MTHLDSQSRQSRQLGADRGTHRLKRPARHGRRVLTIGARITLVGLVAALLVTNQVASASRARQAPAAEPRSAEVSLWSAGSRPQAPADSDTASVEVGTSFRSSQDGSVTGIRFYKHAENEGKHTGNVWDDQGRLLASASFSSESASGWQTARLDKPVPLQAGRWYVASYHAPAGRYADDQYYFGGNKLLTNGVLEARAGVYAYGDRSAYPTQTWRSSSYYADVLFAPTGGKEPIGTITPTAAPTTTKPPAPAPVPTTTRPAPTTTAPRPTPAPTRPPTPPTGKFPDASNTGVPAGTTLTRYPGPCEIRSSVTISGVDASSCSAILVRARGVVIRNSLLPRIDATEGGSYSVDVADSTVKAGSWSDGAVWGYNITATRLDITGAQHSFHCADNCTVTASWLHDQYNPDGGSYHNNAFITNGGTNMVVRGNTLHCTAILNSTDGGCTANVSLFGDFEPVTRVIVDGNLLKANASSISYCAYGGYQPTKAYKISTYIVFTNNVFERGTNRKCGVYGPVTSFQTSATGNVWSNNKWDDGTLLDP